MNNTDLQAESRWIEIGRGTAVSVDVAVGDAIRGIRGRIWLTQEGDTRDHCIAAGMSFGVDSEGRAVLGAVDGDAVAVVARRGVSGVVPGGVRIDSPERVTHAARAAQARYVRSVISGVVQRGTEQLRRLTAKALAALAPH